MHTMQLYAAVHRHVQKSFLYAIRLCGVVLSAEGPGMEAST